MPIFGVFVKPHVYLEVETISDNNAVILAYPNKDEVLLEYECESVEEQQLTYNTIRDTLKAISNI